MAQGKWTIRSYNLFIKTARQRGLSLGQARTAYKKMRGKLGRPVFAADIAKSKKEFVESKKDIVGEQILAEKLVEDLIEDTPENIQTLFDRHYAEPGYRFEVEREILKISISTTKTRKKFSVRLN